MAWKPKTIAGKLLKGAVLAGGSVLALATGVKLFPAVGGAIKKGVNAVKDSATKAGTTAIAQIGEQATSAIKGTIDKVTESAVNLASGKQGEQRAFYKAGKEAAQTGLKKVIDMAKLMREGKTAEEARAIVGAGADEVVEFDGKPVKTAGVFDFLQNKNVLYAGAAVLALLLLTKKSRTRRR